MNTRFTPLCMTFFAHRMMRVLALGLTFLLGSSPIMNAQDYALVKKDASAFFLEENDANIRAVKVDSVSSDSLLSTYEFYKTWNMNASSGIVCPDSAIWIGHHCTVDNEGVYTFFNAAKEEITIHSQAKPGDSWDLYVYSNGDRIKASMGSHSLETVLTFTDSIKTINLQLLDSNGTALNSPLNDLSIRFGKSLGFIQMIEVIDFPNTMKELFLDGLTVQGTSDSYLSWKDIYDFQVGDEFHYVYLESYSTYSISEGMIYQVLDKAIHNGGDSVVYTFNTQTFDISLINGFLPQPDSSSLVLDQIQMSYSFSMDSMLIPDEAIATLRSNTENLIYQFQYSDEHMHRKMLLGSGNIHNIEYQGLAPCWSLFETSVIENKYLEGLGLLSMSANFFDGPSVAFFQVYYKKGSEEWGTHLGIEESLPATEEMIHIYPNPFQNELSIEGLSAFDKMSVVDLLGRKQAFNLISEEPLRIAFEHIPPGIYFLHIEKGQQRLIYKVVRD